MTSTPLSAARQLDENDKLRGAAFCGLAAGVANAMASGGDPLSRDGQGRTALMRACETRFSDESAIEALGALLPFSDPNAVDDNGETALMKAVARGRLGLAQLLAPATDASLRDSAGLTLLMRAAQSARSTPELMSFLIGECGQRVEDATAQGHPALMIAAWNGRECIEPLLEASPAQGPAERERLLDLAACAANRPQRQHALRILLEAFEPGERVVDELLADAVDEQRWLSARALGARASDGVFRAAFEAALGAPASPQELLAALSEAGNEFVRDADLIARLRKQIQAERGVSDEALAQARAVGAESGFGSSAPAASAASALASPVSRAGA